MDEGEQAADGAQTGVSFTRSAPSGLIDLIEETKDTRLGEVFDSQPINGLAEIIGDVAQQKLNGIAVGPQGVHRQAFLHRQIVAKEALQQWGYGMFHDGSPGEERFSR